MRASCNLNSRKVRSTSVEASGSLSRPQNADILAHMLKASGYPAGTTPLTGDAGAMTSITIRMYKP